MTITDRLVVGSVTFLAAALSIIAASPMPGSKQPSDTPRTSAEMCEEVAHELNQQYVKQMITRERAQQIIDRCYHLYTK